MMHIPLGKMMPHLSDDGTDTFSQSLLVGRKYHILKRYVSFPIFSICMIGEFSNLWYESMFKYVWDEFLDGAVI